MERDDRARDAEAARDAADRAKADNADADSAKVREQAFERVALTRQEYITAISHFYRGEVTRSNVWRLRVDATTNWAVGAAAASSGFAFSDPRSTHLILIFGVFVVFALLWIEARRFRIYDVFRARVRRTEENFFGPILTRELDSPMSNWGTLMAADFLHPQFKMSFWEAMSIRLRRNYLVLFMLLLVCWIGKVAYLTGNDGSFADNLASGIGRTPPWLPVAILAVFYSLMLALLLSTARRRHVEHEEWGIGKELETYDA